MHLAPHIGRLIVPKESRSSRRPFDEIVSGKRATPPARESVKNRGAKESQKREPGAPSKTESSKSAGSKASGYRGRRYQEPNRFWNYPRPNKGPVARWLPSWRFLLASILGIGILGIGVFIVAYLLIDVPEPEDVATAESTTVYYADGETEMGQFATIRRHIIDTSELPDHVGDAIVASEDRRFYSNAGVDPVGIVRAFINNITGGKRQGGSTITQQYVERYYTGENQGYRGKAKEAILALKIDRQQSKEEILGNYMNTIYFGRGANGIQQAAIEYFGKDAEELNLSESALLAGIIPAPSVWDPAVSPEQAESRWERTLNLMVESGFITQEERDEQEFPDVKDPGREDTYRGSQGYLLRAVKTELLRQGDFDEEDIDSGGYRIVTTTDPRLQTAAENAAEDLPPDKSPNLRVGLLSVENETGAIKAMYGGEDYLENNLNAATQAHAQSGSTFKVFTLVAALEEGISLTQTFPSASEMTIVPGWAPRNFDGLDRGQINLVTATQHSVNPTYALINSTIGPEKTKDMAIRLGIAPDTPGLGDEVSNVLGSASPTVIDKAEAFATIANEGNKITPHIIDVVESPSGSTVYSAPTSGEEVIESQIAADATYAMTKVIEGGTANRAAAINRPAAGKTGTSQDNKSAWFVGFVPQLTTAVALFQTAEDGTEETLSPMGGYSEIYGGSFPTDIWTKYMLEAVRDLPVEQFPEPSFNQAPAAPQQPAPPQQPSQPSAPEPSPTNTPTPTQEPEPEPDPTQTPTPTEEPEPEPTQEPSPSPTQEPPPDPEPQPTQDSPGSDSGD